MSWKKNWKIIVAASLAVIFYLFILFASTVAFQYYPFDNRNDKALKGVSPLYVLMHWDSVHYLNIVVSGYSGATDTVFFPLYPLCVKFLNNFFGLSAILSGFIVSWLALAGAVFYLYKLFVLDYNRRQSMRAVTLILFAPFAIFWGVIYSESLFLFLSVAVFYYLRQQKWLVAAIFIALAMLTRNVGVFLLPVYLYYVCRSWPRHGLKPKLKFLLAKREELMWLIIPILGVIFYMFYCYNHFGNMFSFVTEQVKWQAYRHFAWPWQTAKVIVEWSKNSQYNFFHVIFREFGSFVFLTITTIYWAWRRRWDYFIYSLPFVLLFSCMAPMYSVNRLAMIIFPMYLAIIDFFKDNEFAYNAFLIFSVSNFLFWAYWFATNSWVG